MKKQWPVIFIAFLIITGLYLLELSKIRSSGNSDMATLDELDIDKSAAAWEPFYRVRATLIDGQSARFSIPGQMKKAQGQYYKLTGACVFYGNGCSRRGDTVTVSEFYLLPSLGLANACVIEPDIEMRWTVRVMLSEDWILHRDDMINSMARVSGTFRIDTSHPYEGVFFLDQAAAHLITDPDTL
ncbi:MAG: hypothetical protein U5R06_14265 [candidate division KSB1 bacterium]|nr:hypothetical protein [candidate division KSB1 bacterium]